MARSQRGITDERDGFSDSDHQQNIKGIVGSSVLNRQLLLRFRPRKSCKLLVGILVSVFFVEHLQLFLEVGAGVDAGMNSNESMELSVVEEMRMVIGPRLVARSK
jgi:hypothetical protein